MSSAPTGDCFRVLQVHPSRRCNLRCAHCYSSSSPEEHSELRLELLELALEDARTEGFNVVGLSGGEPLLYGSLPQLLGRARALGFRTTVTSNGLLLTEGLLDRIQTYIDVLAVSLDGVPASHNRIRGHPRAFEILEQRFALLRRRKVPFGLIFTLTQDNLGELEWVARFAVECGAALLQIHPLEPQGRALEEMPGRTPDSYELGISYLEISRVAALVGEAIQLQVDFSDRDVLRANPARGLAGGNFPEPSTVPLAGLVSPLVIEADGMVVPVRYGFPRRYALGRLDQARLVTLATRWKSAVYTRFREACNRTFQEATAPVTLPFFNWYEELTRTAAQS